MAVPRVLRSLVLVLLLVPFAPAGAEAALTCGDLPDLTTLYFQKHLRYRRLDDDLRQRVAENLVTRFDPQRVLFLDEDAKRWTDSLAKLFDDTRNGDCTRMRELQQEVVARHAEAEGFVRGFVGSEDYALDREAELVLDPEERGWPRTRSARDELLRTLVHFQITNYTAAGTELPEARKRLAHRYELQTRRAREQSRDDLYAVFLDAFASALDPHSNYLSADVLEDFQIQMQLSLEGIGVALSERDGYSVVEQIIPGGAAAQLDVLRPKDRIIAVAEEGEESIDVIDMALRDVVRLIRGKKGTRVQLTVLRQGEDTERFNVSILRDTIDLEEQAAKLRIEEVEADGKKLKLGVLDLPSFYGDRDPTKRQGSRDVAKLLREARAKKVDGLVLDLSRNGGGLLEDAVTISGFFIREGGIVAIRGPGEKPRVLEDPDDGLLWDRPLVVLTSRVSASASEILAGALKDYRRAVVVGDDHTFGKGSVQSVFPLRPGQGALKVTTALFYRPGGTSTQHGGVETHVVIPSLLNHDAFGERNLPYSLRAETIPPFASADANATNAAEGPGYRPVADDVLTELARRSRARVLEDEFFRRIEEQLAERAADDGMVTLAELMAERDEEQDGTSSAGLGSPGSETAGVSVDASPEDVRELSPHAKEALRILADLVLLTS